MSSASKQPKALPLFQYVNMLTWHFNAKAYSRNAKNACLLGHYLAYRVLTIIGVATNLVATVLSLALALLTSPLLCHHKTAYIPKYFKDRFKDSAKLTCIFLMFSIFGDCIDCMQTPKRQPQVNPGEFV